MNDVNYLVKSNCNATKSLISHKRVLIVLLFLNRFNAWSNSIDLLNKISIINCHGNKY